MSRDDPPVAALSIEGLSFSYGARGVLSDVSFQVPKGTVTVLLGPNGAGKTTLFGLITGLLAPQSGHIRVFGRSRAVEGARVLGDLGIVFQQPTLDLDLSVAQNLAYFAGLRGLSGAQAAEGTQRELERFALWERRDEAVRQLNGGHRRRVEIARACLDAPPVLVLDEPTVGLDIPTRRALVADLHARARDDGAAVLWATHLVDEVWPGDRLVVLNKGEVRAAGSLEDVLASTGRADLEAAFDALTAAGAAA
ncbi:MAG: ATP-binding cassette domain-containing protein [Kiloniellales bacterium]